MPGWLKRAQAWGSWTCWGLPPGSPTAPGYLNIPSSSLLLTPGRCQRSETIFLLMSCKSKTRDLNMRVKIFKITINLFVLNIPYWSDRWLWLLMAVSHVDGSTWLMLGLPCVDWDSKTWWKKMHFSEGKKFCVLQTTRKWFKIKSDLSVGWWFGESSM